MILIEIHIKQQKIKNPVIVNTTRFFEGGAVVLTELAVIISVCNGLQVQADGIYLKNC